MSGIDPEELELARRVLSPRQFLVWHLRLQGMSWGDMRWYLRVDRSTCLRYYQRAVQKLELARERDE